MFKGAILVRADWDPEARVFVATSEDVPGLVAEAATTDALHEKLMVLIPELLELNSPSGDSQRGPLLSVDRHWEDVPLVILSQQVSKVRLYT